MAAEGTEFEGTIKSVNRDVFMVDVEHGDHVFPVRCSIAGRLRKFQIRLAEGDRVRVEVQNLDLNSVSQGRINRRL